MDKSVLKYRGTLVSYLKTGTATLYNKGVQNMSSIVGMELPEFLRRMHKLSLG